MSYGYAIYVDTPLSETELLKYVAMASQMPHKLSEFSPVVGNAPVYSLASASPCFSLSSHKPDLSIVKKLAELFEITPTVELYFGINITNFYENEGCEEIWADIIKCLLVEIPNDIIILLNGEKVGLVKSEGKVKVDSKFQFRGIETMLDIDLSFEPLPLL